MCFGIFGITPDWPTIDGIKGGIPGHISLLFLKCTLKNKFNQSYNFF